MYWPHAVGAWCEYTDTMTAALYPLSCAQTTAASLILMGCHQSACAAASPRLMLLTLSWNTAWSQCMLRCDTSSRCTFTKLVGVPLPQVCLPCPAACHRLLQVLEKVAPLEKELSGLVFSLEESQRLIVQYEEELVALDLEVRHSRVAWCALQICVRGGGTGCGCVSMSFSPMGASASLLLLI